MRPVFVVGAPRSGTTLLAAMLSSHRSFSCGPETHFFVNTTQRRRDRAVRGRWPESAAGLLSQLKFEGSLLVELYGHSSQDLLEALAVRPRRQSSLLEAITGPFAARMGKSRWVEKTPNHLLHLSE